jgi:hypothetical protein
MKTEAQKYADVGYECLLAIGGGVCLAAVITWLL